MRILFYNWIQFDKKNNSGGGVNVYQKNIIDYLVNNTDHEIFFLSSGIYYDLVSKKIRIKESNNVYGSKCRTFKLINSTCMAPVKALYEDIETYLTDMSVYNVFANFVKEHHFDVIHFNNIEGLPLNCLKIKRDFPETRVIYSLHNYYMFCPQVNLFYHNEKNCDKYDDSKACCRCLADSFEGNSFKNYYKLDNKLEKLHMEELSDKAKAFGKNLHNKKKEKPNHEKKETIGNPRDFYRFKKHNVGTLNKYVDEILAVSERVGEIAVRSGVDPAKIKVNYIGTKVAETSLGHYHGRVNKDEIIIAFMGYFDKFKGLSFLLDALEKLPEIISQKIVFKCYARKKIEEDQLQIDRVEKLKEKLGGVEYYDGYNHDELPEIMSKVDLGIVPVVWEDNLPQVAIEFAAYGVPVLASDLGGAHELSKSDKFIFKGGDIDDFTAKLIEIVNKPELLDEYFEKMMKLVTVQDHIDYLIRSYIGNN